MMFRMTSDPKMYAVTSVNVVDTLHGGKQMLTYFVGKLFCQTSCPEENRRGHCSTTEPHQPTYTHNHVTQAQNSVPYRVITCLINLLCGAGKS
jgi:hypothetical protein